MGGCGAALRAAPAGSARPALGSGAGARQGTRAGRDYGSQRAARRCGRSWAARPRLRGRGERRGGAGEKRSGTLGLLGESRARRRSARPPRRAAPPRCRRPRRGGEAGPAAMRLPVRRRCRPPAAAS